MVAPIVGGTSAAFEPGMRSFAYWSFSLCVIAAAAAGCGAQSKGSSGGSGTVKPNPRTTTSAQRAIEEADIIQVDGGLLYAMSKSGTVSIVDIATPGQLALLGQTTLAGEPFEMYRRGDFLIAMSNDAVGTDGRVTVTRTGVDSGGGALVSVLDVRDPSQLVEVATLKVPGEIADSRVVGNVLYVASYENLLCYGCGNLPRTMVTTFNIASPTAIALIEQVSFDNTAPTTDTTVWGSNWKRSIVVTSQRLYLGGHVELDPNGYGSADEGLIDVLDISDPNGRLKVGVRIIVAGAILSRWQVDEWQGVLRVVSQRGVGRAVNGLSAPEVDTFQVDSALAVRPLGHMTINTGRPEGLRAVRFDGARAYAITYATPQRTDPLFVIDLANPAAPRQRGQLSIPGFMYHLEPRGDRVLALGVDGTDPNGSLNVSLFDVAAPDAPRQLARVAFAPPYLTEQYTVMNEMAEDQDRIQKAFRAFEDGVVVVPFSAPRQYSASGTSCDGAGGGVQVIAWQGDTLSKGALLPVPGNPRRAFEHEEALLTVSDSNVRAFSLENLAVAHQTADVVIGTCVPDTDTFVGPSNGSAGGWEGEGGRAPLACSAAGSGFVGWHALAFAFAFTLVMARARRRSR
jgi:hypothetical protein